MLKMLVQSKVSCIQWKKDNSMLHISTINLITFTSTLTDNLHVNIRLSMYLIVVLNNSIDLR